MVGADDSSKGGRMAQVSWLGLRIGSYLNPSDESANLHNDFVITVSQTLL